MKVPFKNCTAEICKLCPHCNRKVDVLGDWFYKHGDTVSLSVRIACPAGHFGTSFYDNLEDLLSAWCEICVKNSKRGYKK
jgi:hypothetical protein